VFWTKIFTSSLLARLFNGRHIVPRAAQFLIKVFILSILSEGGEASIFGGLY
jgi:hypothetical protein